MVAPLVSKPTTTKWGGANFLMHSHDGLKATCVIEIYEQQETPKDDREWENPK